MNEELKCVQIKEVIKTEDDVTKELDLLKLMIFIFMVL